MHIFYATPSTAHQSALPDSLLWRNNLYSPLVELENEITEFQFDYSEFNENLNIYNQNHRQFIDQNRPRFGEELLDQVKKVHRLKPIELFFSYFYSAYVEPDVIREIGAMGITTINWYCNASYQFHLVEEIAPAYHYCLVPEKFRLEDYRRVGANPIYCQEAANPHVYKPYALPKEFDVTFVGQKYGNRPGYIRYLIDRGIETRAWGPHWDKHLPQGRRWARELKDTLLNRPRRDVPPKYCGAPLSDEEYIKMYSRGKISLGFTTVAETPEQGEPIKQVRLRDFEATMSGAFYLVEYFDELTEFFEPDQEIVCFSSPEELADKAKYYLAHDSERERIRLAGMKRTREEHTWQKRFETVFKQIGLLS
jgi:spore maturation protein CgeB